MESVSLWFQNKLFHGIIYVVEVLYGGVNMGKDNLGTEDKESTFYRHMWDLRNNVDLVYEIVKLLECCSIDDRKDQSRDFGISYVIKLLEKYCSEDDCEFMLAAYGFLEEFTYIDKSCDERATLYWQYACKYETHKFIKSSWGIQSVPALFRRRHQKILQYLDEITSDIMSKNNGKLGLLGEVPKKLEFPKPREIKEPSVGQPDEAMQQDESLITLNVTAKEDKLGHAPDEADSTIEPEREEPNVPANLGGDINNDEIKTSLVIHPKETKNLQEEPVHPIPKEPNEADEEKNKKIVELLSSLSRSLYIFAYAFCFFVLIYGFTSIESIKLTDNAKENILQEDAPTTKEALTIPDDVDQDVLPEVESFTISEKDKEFTLTPGHWEKLDIELDPPDADISSLVFNNLNPDIVSIADGYVMAAESIPEGEPHVAYIIIETESESHSDIVCITVVENPIAPDGLEPPIGSGGTLDQTSTD